MTSPNNYCPASPLPSSMLVVPIIVVISSRIPLTINPAALEITLKRGCMHPRFDIYVGGSALTVEYNLTSAHSNFSTSQLHTQRSLNIAKTSLHSQRGDTTPLNFKVVRQRPLKNCPLRVFYHSAYYFQV